MKTLISNIILLAVALLTPLLTQAQGTIYLSNLEQASTGSVTIGSDSWLAALFLTGNNAAGYALNSVQLALTDATGNPSGFTAMIYSAIIGDGINPGSSLGTLDGSLNPATVNIYTYTDDSNIILSPSTHYFIVLTAGTTIANGAYEWSLAGTDSYNPSGHWRVIQGVSSDVFQSSDGLSWNSLSATYPQFAITATPVPEPSPSLLLLLGSGIFVYTRRTLRR
jgi:hypothetical protein